MNLFSPQFSEEQETFSLESQTIDCLRLIRSENIGIKTFFTLMKMYGNAENALEKAGDMSIRGGKQKPISICSKDKAVKEIEQCAKIGARLITFYDEEYPELLKQISDPPPVITILGNDSVLNQNTIGMVGARNATANGCRFAYKLATDLGENGYVVASGLARGIDTAAHKGSISSGTIAVIAGGINHIYPKENAGLYEQIKENGAIIAELPFDSAPKAQHFPRRNRIISGLSLGTVVVEAAIRSGSLITSRLALEQNREVFAVPGSPLDPRAEGPNKLIKQGAHLVESVNDILDNLNQSSHKLNIGMFEDTLDDEYEFEKVHDEGDIASARQIIKDLLSSTPIQVDEIISHTSIPAHVVQVTLLELELAGNLTRHPGNKVSLLV